MPVLNVCRHKLWAWDWGWVRTRVRPKAIQIMHKMWGAAFNAWSAARCPYILGPTLSLLQADSLGPEPEPS